MTARCCLLNMRICCFSLFYTEFIIFGFWTVCQTKHAIQGLCFACDAQFLLFAAKFQNSCQQLHSRLSFSLPGNDQKPEVISSRSYRFQCKWEVWMAHFDPPTNPRLPVRPYESAGRVEGVPCPQWQIGLNTVLAAEQKNVIYDKEKVRRPLTLLTKSVA